MIPKIIHQTWTSRDIPESLQPLHETWLQYHPDWEFRLWTDSDCRALVAETAPDFLSLYDAYPAPIYRVDVFRYFLMMHLGGLYVDLDFECLRALDPLLDGKSLVLGEEPTSHLRHHRKARPGLRQIIGNAFIASACGHPFWSHVIDRLFEQRDELGPLDATGPFFLTRAYEDYGGKESLEILPAPVLYPLDSAACEQGLAFDLSYWISKTRNAFAVHHWLGSWWREDSDRPLGVGFQTQAKLLVYGMRAAGLTFYPGTAILVQRPLVSCLMVTRNRFAQAVCAINCFKAQTYAPTELVILDDSDSGDLELWCSEQKDERIRYHRLREKGSVLGELRNRAVALAEGDYVCQWDDDDLYDPLRIQIQMAVIGSLKTDACFLSRWMCWWPYAKRLAISTSRVWEGSLVCATGSLPKYPEQLRQGEDTAVTDILLKSARVALVDMPGLYLYVRHCNNSFDASHFDRHWTAAEATFEGEEYERATEHIGKRLDLDASLLALDLQENGSSVLLDDDEAVGDTPAPNTATRIDSGSGEWPPVLILTPIKNCAAFIPGVFDNLKHLRYPSNRLSLGFLEGDSDDGSWDVLREHKARYGEHFKRIQCEKYDTGFRTSGPRWLPQQQAQRRSIIAQCRNRLFASAYQDEPWTLWLDADVIHFPDVILQQLLGCNKSILVPHCVQTPFGKSFDLNTFRYMSNGEALASKHRVDGLIQPPRGECRRYLEDFRGQHLVEVDAVGATMLLVESWIHNTGLLFPEESFRGYIETEGFAMQARDRGLSCWGLPDVEIIHARN